MTRVQPLPKPVVLTGYDASIYCPECKTVQMVGDDPTGKMEAETGDHVSLHALPGKYIFVWRLTCWQCSHPFSGVLEIASRATNHAGPERRRVWGG